MKNQSALLMSICNMLINRRQFGCISVLSCLFSKNSMNKLGPPIQILSVEVISFVNLLIFGLDLLQAHNGTPDLPLCEIPRHFTHIERPPDWSAPGPAPLSPNSHPVLDCLLPRLRLRKSVQN
jgi:hypothetical protein